MPSEELLRRLEALNGGPLREAITVEGSLDAVVEPQAEAGVAVVKTARRSLTSRSTRAAGAVISLHDAVPGEERFAGGERPYYHVERMLTEQLDWACGMAENLCAAIPGVRSGRTRRNQAVPQPQELMFVDLETLGLNGQSPIFLVGMVGLDADGRVYCRQLLAREPEEERAAIAIAAQALESVRLLVSYNGRGYDLPLLRSRAAHFGIAIPEPAAHVDMLLEAKRRYGRKLTNCRLQTLEEHVCGRCREDDVPSNRIPGVYRRFVKTGDATQLRRVIHHNLLDLATTAELFTLFFR
jgi:uncharacterized protein YprB with RNaseH-like and TPR domain